MVRYGSGSEHQGVGCQLVVSVGCVASELLVLHFGGPLVLSLLSSSPDTNVCCGPNILATLVVTLLMTRAFRTII